jgi:hypothetical protein
MPPMHKLGTLTPCIYFVNHRDPRHPEGYIMLAPYTDCPTPEGYSRHEAGTLADIDTLQRRLLEQCQREWEQEMSLDEAQWRSRWDAITDRLHARLVSSSTSEYDKAFIREYIKLRVEKRDRHRQRFTERTAYIYAREMDLGSRRADEER